MPRSRFEQLIDAGLSSPQMPSAKARSVSSPRSAWQMAASPIPPHSLSTEETSAAKPHLSAHDLRLAYRDWLTPAAEDRETVAEAAPEPEEDAGQKAPSQSEPSLPDLLTQLANHSQLTRQQLQTLRRQLARRLHPDLATAKDRRTATIKMAKLNAIVDAALRARVR